MYVLKEVYELITQTINILMESVPEDIDFEKVKTKLASLSGVKEINDLHIWQTDSNTRFLSAHIEIENVENGKRTDLIVEVQKEMLEDFKINHTTVQMVSATEAEKLKLNCEHCN